MGEKSESPLSCMAGGVKRRRSLGGRFRADVGGVGEKIVDRRGGRDGSEFFVLEHGEELAIKKDNEVADGKSWILRHGSSFRPSGGRSGCRFLSLTTINLPHFDLFVKVPNFSRVKC